MKLPTPEPTSATITRHDHFMSINYGRYPVVISSGKGADLWDADGKRYLDLFAGFGAPVLGHCHPELVDAVTQQAERLWHVGNLFHTEPQTRAAEAISRLGFGGRSFFCHSGADANESAIKLARLYGKAHPGSAAGEFGRYKIVSCLQSFHGRSFATMNATANPKVREGFGPHLPGYINVAYNDIQAVRSAIDEETVAILAEPIQGEGGINVPSPDYFPQLRRLCDEHDVLLICDEVWTGCGRCGKTFAYQNWLGEGQGSPDIMTLGKGVGGGLAVGVMCAKPELAELYNAKTQGGVKHATTLGGNCLSMAVTAKIFEIIERDDLAARSAKLGAAVLYRLRELARAHSAVVDVRGHGLFMGIQLDPSAAEAWFDSAADVVQRCMDRGVLINATGRNVIRLAPPLTIEEHQLDAGIRVLTEVLTGA